MNQEIKKPFYLESPSLPYCIERSEKLSDKLFVFECILESLNSFPYILELLEQYPPLGEDENSRKMLNGFIESSKIYHLFAKEQFELLKQEIKKNRIKTDQF